MSETFVSMDGTWVAVRDGVLGMKGSPYGQSVRLKVNGPGRLAAALRATVDGEVSGILVFGGDGGLVTVSPVMDDLEGLCAGVAMVGNGQVGAVLSYDEACVLAAMLEGQ